MDDKPANDVRDKRRSWNDEHTRALILPVVGVLGMLGVVVLAAASHVGGDIVVCRDHRDRHLDRSSGRSCSWCSQAQVEHIGTSRPERRLGMGVRAG